MTSLIEFFLCDLMSFCVEVTILLEKKKIKTSRLRKDFVNLGVFFLRISAKQKTQPLSARLKVTIFTIQIKTKNDNKILLRETKIYPSLFPHSPNNYSTNYFVFS
jgi:hypothetical protein